MRKQNHAIVRQHRQITITTIRTTSDTRPMTIHRITITTIDKIRNKSPQRLHRMDGKIKKICNAAVEEYFVAMLDHDATAFCTSLQEKCCRRIV